MDSVTTMTPCEAFLDESTSDTPVRGFLHRPDGAPSAGLVLTHGAGSNCQSPPLIALSNAFSRAGWLLLRCDLPFRQMRPHGPPARGSAERDQAGLRAAIAALRPATSGRIYLGGHSYGGRQASMLAAAGLAAADALLLLSYPLHPPQRPDAMRTAHLPDLHTPALFVHGDNDSFGSIEEMQQAIRLIPARTELLPIPNAGHELINRSNRSALTALVAKAFTHFIAP